MCLSQIPTTKSSGENRTDRWRRAVPGWWHRCLTLSLLVLRSTLRAASTARSSQCAIFHRRSSRRRRTLVFPGATRYTEVSYEAHNADVKKAFAYAGIRLSSTTHAWRKSGAKALDESR